MSRLKQVQEAKELAGNPVFLVCDALYSHTYGKVMTLVEALCPTHGEEQRKAIKSLVGDAFFGGHYYDLAYPLTQEEWQEFKSMIEVNPKKK